MIKYLGNSPKNTMKVITTEYVKSKLKIGDREKELEKEKIESVCP